MDYKKTSLALFIDLHLPAEVSKDQKVDLILSPSLYWVKKVSLAVKNLRELKKFLPSLFEDTLPAGKYSYTAYEDEQGYMIFAYDDKVILDLLAEKEISLQQVNGVYFAQSEFQDLQDALEIDEDFVLDVANRIVLKLPKSLVLTSKPMQLQWHVFSKHPITLSRYTHFATPKSLLRFALFLGMLLAIYTFEWIRTEIKITELRAVPQELFAKHKLPATKLQTQAMFETLHKNYEQQLKLREITAALLNLKLQEGENITLYDLQNEKLKITLKLLSAKQTSTLIKAMQKFDASLRNTYSHDLLQLEFDL